MNSQTHRLLLYRIRRRFLQQGCACGEKDPRKLECHHRRPCEKTATISDLIWSNAPALELIAELEKCEVVCTECHDRIHGQERRRKQAGLSL